MISLQVAGVPAPQGSKRAFVRGGQARMVDGGSAVGKVKLDSWRQAVATAARDWLGEHPQPPVTGPVSINVEFRFAPTKSDPYRFWHTGTPDIDKIQRSTFDALVSAGLLADDRIISRVQVSKAYCSVAETAGCEICIYSLAEEEVVRRQDRKQAAAEARKTAQVAS